MVILRSQNKITDFFMILAWASPFKVPMSLELSNGNPVQSLSVVFYCLGYANGVHFSAILENTALVQ